MTDASRVAVTPEAAELLRSLRARHGSLMFHQSGGCCDGSSPMCYPKGEFITGASDVLLGTIDISAGDISAGDSESESSDDLIEVWMGRAQFEYWSHTHLTIDVVDGRGAGFSLEAPTGRRFLIRSRLFTDAEVAELAPLSS